MSALSLSTDDALAGRINDLFAAGAYREAEPLARELLNARLAALGPEHHDVGMAANTLGIALHESGAHAEARVLFERAVAIMEHEAGVDHPNHAMVLGNLARLLDDMDDPETAGELFERATAGLVRALGPEHPEVALALNNWGSSLHQQGEYEAALVHFERAAAILERAGGKVAPDLGMVLSNLGRLHADRGDYGGARQMLGRALEIHEAAHGPLHPDVGTSTAALASLLHDLGDYPAARPLYERALQILEDALGPDHLHVSDVLNDLGRLLHDQGDLSSAEPLYRRALRIREQVLGGAHTEVAASLDNLAVLLHDQRVLDEALRLYERALAIREAALAPDHPAVAGSLTNLGALRLQQGRPAAARALYERALRIWEAAVGGEHADTALAMHNLATALEEMGELAAAGRLYERACQGWSAALGPDHPDVALCVRNLAALRWMQGDADGARPLLLRAAGAMDRHASSVLPTLSVAEQRAFVDMALADLAGPLLSLADGPAGLEAAYGAIAGWKGLLLDGLRRQSVIAALADDPAHADEVAAWRAACARVAHAWRAGEPPGTLAAYEAERERLERALARVLPPDAHGVWDGVDALRAALPRDTAFVDVYGYVRWEAGLPVGRRYGAVVLSPVDPPVLADLGPADEVDDAVQAYRAGVDRTRGLDGRVCRIRAQVRATLPPGTAHAWIAPDGALTRVPWGGLDEDGAAAPGAVLAQVPSARGLLRLLRAGVGDGAGPLLLATAVDFGPPGPEGTVQWPPLSGTAAEGRAITGAARAAGVPLRTLSGADATPAAVASAVAGAAWVHLATHGYFGLASFPASDVGRTAALRTAPGGAPPLPRRSPLAASGVALAGANQGPRGTLSAEEMLALRLDTARLVVLSACDTGRGDEVPGQGVLGLQAAVQAAGARALLMSLWPVPDDATAALMGAFYRGLWRDGLAPADALRRAQASVRRRAGWGAPLCWAGWALVGDVFRPVLPFPGREG